MKRMRAQAIAMTSTSSGHRITLMHCIYKHTQKRSVHVVHTYIHTHTQTCKHVQIYVHVHKTSAPIQCSESAAGKKSILFVKTEISYNTILSLSVCECECVRVFYATWSGELYVWHVIYDIFWFPSNFCFHFNAFIKYIIIIWMAI